MVIVVTDPYLVCPAASFFSSAQWMSARAILSSFAADLAELEEQKNNHERTEQNDKRSRYMFWIN